jgi:hypothetical protein
MTNTPASFMKRLPQVGRRCYHLNWKITWGSRGRMTSAVGRAGLHHAILGYEFKPAGFINMIQCIVLDRGGNECDYPRT